MLTVILSPALAVSRFQPNLTAPAIPCISKGYSIAGPFACGTVTVSHICGLVHSKLLTVPSKVTVLVASNMAKEWCAKAGSAINDAASPAANIVREFIPSSSQVLFGVATDASASLRARGPRFVHSLYG